MLFSILFFGSSHPKEYEVVSHWSFDLYSLMVSGIKYLFLSFLVIYMSSLEKCLFKSFFTWFFPSASLGINWSITYVNLRYTSWWFDTYLYCSRITIEGLVNTSIILHTHIYMCVCIYVCIYTHTHTHVFFFRFFSHIGNYRILSRVPCAMWEVLSSYLFYV